MRHNPPPGRISAPAVSLSKHVLAGSGVLDAPRRSRAGRRLAAVARAGRPRLADGRLGRHPGRRRPPAAGPPRSLRRDRDVLPRRHRRAVRRVPAARPGPRRHRRLGDRALVGRLRPARQRTCRAAARRPRALRRASRAGADAARGPRRLGAASTRCGAGPPRASSVGSVPPPSTGRKLRAAQDSSNGRPASAPARLERPAEFDDDVDVLPALDPVRDGRAVERPRAVDRHPQPRGEAARVRVRQSKRWTANALLQLDQYCQPVPSARKPSSVYSGEPGYSSDSDQ